jgi:ankyrin repeat protein
MNVAAQRALLSAVERGDLESCAQALESGANVSWPDAPTGGRPPLLVAADRGDRAAVEWLLAHGAFPLGCRDGSPPRFAFEAALERGDIDMARRILGAVEWLDESMCGVAVEALARGPHDDVETLEFLLAAPAAGRRVSSADLCRALDAAAGRGHLALVDALIGGGARLDSVAPAARAGEPDILRALAAAGASLNLRDNQTAETPLHLAVAAPRLAAETVDALLRLGCRHNGRRTDGLTPADVALEIGRPEIAALIADLAPRCGPRWMRDARARGIGRYVFYMSRALGLGFDPNESERPILWEGDYVGFGWELTAAEAIDRWARDFAPRPEPREATVWFVPFIEKLARREDFGLDELEAASPHFTIESA